MPHLPRQTLLRLPAVVLLCALLAAPIAPLAAAAQQPQEERGFFSGLYHDLKVWLGIEPSEEEQRAERRRQRQLERQQKREQKRKEREARAQGQGQGQGQEQARRQRAAAVLKPGEFDGVEQAIAIAYYHERRLVQQRAQPAGKNQLPRDSSMPLGWDKSLSKGGTLPEELLRQGKPLPDELLRALKPQPAGMRTLQLGEKILRIEDKTRRIVDMFNL